MEEPVRTSSEPIGQTHRAWRRTFITMFGRTTKVLIVLACLLAPLSLAAVVLLHAHARGKLPMTWQRHPLKDFEPEQGKGYVCKLHSEWMSAHEKPSPALVLEDGVPLGPGNVIHQEVRDEGAGRFSFWHAEVLFSTSDNSDPRTNQRRYEVYWPTPVRPRVSWAVIVAAVALNALACFFGVPFVLPLVRTRFAGPAGRLCALRDRLLGNPSFAAASVVFVAALVVQLVNFGLHFRDPEMARTGYSILGVPFTDARGWYAQGASLACGQGMTASWPAIRPGYGLFLALFFTWTGPSYLLAVALNLLLMALAAALLCQVGEKLVSRWVGVVAALGFAVQHLSLTYPLTLGTETMGLFCSVAALHQLLRGIETGKHRSFLWAGVFFGLSNLARPLTLPAFPFYVITVVWCLWGSRPRLAPLARAAVFGAGVFLVIAPWVLRQWLAFGILTISDNTADCLYAATSPRYGMWTGEIYREPDFTPKSVKEKYDHFANKARANLRADPAYYVRNVATSYCACFRNLSASVRPHLMALGLLVILGPFVTLRGPDRARYRSGICALALGFIALAFLLACTKSGAWLDLAALLLLPLVVRRRVILVHVVGVLGAILGVAMFGMGNPDPRLLFSLEWGFLLSSLACLHGCCSRAMRCLAPADLIDEGRAPAPATEPGLLLRFYSVLRVAALIFVVVSGVRLAILNATTPTPSYSPHLLDEDQALQVVRAFDRHAPGMLRQDDLRAGQVWQHIRELETSSRSDQNKILVLPIRLVGTTYYLPENTVLSHWSRFFTSRDYDRSVCYFNQVGVPAPKFGPYFAPVLFPGFVPPRLTDRDVVLICRMNFDLTYRKTGEELLLEGIALIPTDEQRNLLFDDAYFATHPHHPGTNPLPVKTPEGSTRAQFGN